MPGLTLCRDPYGVADRADALVLCTEWGQFAELDWGKIKSAMVRPLILDGRNFLDREKMMALGFEYLGIGRGAAGTGGRR
jgi:UDPglucose 6-dehydrogenase